MAALRADGTCVGFGMLNERRWLGLCRQTTRDRDRGCVQRSTGLLLQPVHPLRRAQNLNFRCQMSAVTRSPENYEARNICENHLVTFLQSL